MKIYNDIFGEIISLKNLFLAWDEFKKDKKNKKDVMRFEWKLEENIFQLHRDLKYKRYEHGAYSSFHIRDPKQRHIHKATVRDRVLHHAIFAKLNPIFEPTFIANSFSCRIDKGTHKGVDTVHQILRQVSQNNTRKCFAIKCDISKFFDSVNHKILKNLISRKIKDPAALALCYEVIDSFSTTYRERDERGLSIGNLTSQLFANIYMNKLDQFVKHELKIKCYTRYTDDFVIISRDMQYLQQVLVKIKYFLKNNLRLNLHPHKIILRKFSQGVDFLGYVSLSRHRLLRTKTKQRIFKKLKLRTREYKNGLISKKTLEQCLQSYLGVLSHADSHKLSQDIKNQFWFWLSE